MKLTTKNEQIFSDNDMHVFCRLSDEVITSDQRNDKFSLGLKYL